MERHKQSSKRDSSDISSSKSDNWDALAEALRAARLSRRLSQQALAAKLGFRQRQISDVERARVDPRLSTIRNVSRALDLELMLIPRHLISAVEGLLRAGSEAANRPLYAFDGEAEGEPDHDRPAEVGGGRPPDARWARKERP
jgi:transcriptional regulator with XRE-family HTH domain